MKILCDKASLVSAMDTILKAVPNRTTNPYLECVLIEAVDDTIRLTSNDMEMCINTVLEGEIKEPGTTAIEANMLNNIARKLPAGDISISVENGSASALVQGGKSKFNIPCKDGDGFVSMPSFTNGTMFAVPQSALREIIMGVVFCADLTSQTAMMTGCFFELDGTEFKVTALDGHRVGIRKTVIATPVEKTSCVVPAKTLIEVSKIIRNTQELVHINVSKSNIIFQFDNTILLSRLIAGDYFKTDKLAKMDVKTEFKADASEFIDCLNRSTVLLKQGDKKPLILEITDGNVHFHTMTSMGVADEDMEIDKEGDDLKVGFNPRFLLDAVNAIGTDEIEMRLSGARTPAVFTDDSGDYSYIVLPINI